MEMKKEDRSSFGFDAPCGRITRARAAALRENGKVLPLSQSLGNPEKQQTCRGISKRMAVDENSHVAASAAPKRKKRAVLKDVTNVSSQNKVLPLSQSLGNPEKQQTCRGISKRMAVDENSHVAASAAPKRKKRAVLKDVTNVSSQTTSRKWIPTGIPTGKLQPSAAQRGKSGPSKPKRRSDTKSSKLSLVGNGLTEENLEDKVTQRVGNVNVLVSKESSLSEKVDDSLVALKQKESVLAGNTSFNGHVESKIVEEVHKVELSLSKESSRLEELGDCLVLLQQKESIQDRGSTCITSLFERRNSKRNLEQTKHEKKGGCIGLDIVDIDTDLENPQMCCKYASEIYINQCAAELVRRPMANFMETLQRDITQSMRGILIDWLVEVSEEYRLVPDTLYLTVYMIDKFLSRNYMERQRLQLLGITCMLIASKYEEICAPRVEEFCFITDNTYTKAEVLKMETEILGFLGFQLSIPTIKTFLRRFLRAANALDKNPLLTFGYLANYLAELTLVEYNFIKFLPSVVAASAVFLARWTLDQTKHPWNKTLEYYTSYKAIDLKDAVSALQELQMNSKNCPLNAIREKYRQEKFECVASLPSPSLKDSLFC